MWDGSLFTLMSSTRKREVFHLVWMPFNVCWYRDRLHWIAYFVTPDGRKKTKKNIFNLLTLFPFPAHHSQSERVQKHLYSSENKCNMACNVDMHLRVNYINVNTCRRTLEGREWAEGPQYPDVGINDSQWNSCPGFMCV